MLPVNITSFNRFGFGFSVQGLGFRVQDFGLKVQDSGFRVKGLGSRVEQTPSSHTVPAYQGIKGMSCTRFT